MRSKGTNTSESPNVRRRLGRGRQMLVVGTGVSVALLTLSACGSSSKSANGGSSSGGSKPSSSSGSSINGLYGALPPSGGTPSPGGTITIGIQKTSVPTYISPIIPAADGSVYTVYDFINLLNQPLYWSPQGSVPKIDDDLSIANQPTYSNDDKTVTFTIKPWMFSNGTPVTGNSVVEYIDILKAAVKESAANFSNYTPGFMPDNVASATASGQTVTLNLTKAYNPQFFTDNELALLYAFPTAWAVSSAGGPTLDYTQPANAKAIYDYLNKQAATVSTFATNPLWQISDGPMKITSFNATSGEYTMAPNPTYGGPQKAQYSTLDAKVFTTFQAEFNEQLAGGIDIGQVDYSDLPQISKLKGLGDSVFGLPDFGFEAAFFNFQDTTGHFDKIIAQPYVRQAMASLLDQESYVRGIFKGAGGVAYGPVSAIPASPFTPANAINNPYPYSVSAASKMLSSHGWKVVPNGTTTCQSAGTGPTDCGAGIPAGTPLSFNWQYGNQPDAIGQQSVAFASAAKQVGINITLQEKTFNYLIANDADPSAPSNKNNWAVVDFGGFTNSLYPTTNNIFNTGGSYNQGGYSDPKADSLINASVFGGNPSAVTNEASYLTQAVPALFQPNPDLIYAVKSNIGGTADSFSALTQYTWTPQYWFIKK